MWQVFEEVMARLGVAGGREMETLFNVMDQALCVLPRAVVLVS